MPSPLTITQDDLNRAGDAAMEYATIYAGGAQVSGHPTPDIPSLATPPAGKTAEELLAYFIQGVVCAIARISADGMAGGEPYPVNLPVFTMATLPASANTGAIVYCSDATAPVGPPPGIAGGVCYYDGSAWRRVDNQATV
jgi:hypothetical protein